MVIIFVLFVFVTYQARDFSTKAILYRHYLFVLRFYGPVNPMGSCRAQSVYLNTNWAGLVLQALNQYYAHSFARNWQLPFLNQRNRENNHTCRKYSMIKSLWKNAADPMGGGGVKPTTSRSLVGCTSNWATEASFISIMYAMHYTKKYKNMKCPSPFCNVLPYIHILYSEKMEVVYVFRTLEDLFCSECLLRFLFGITEKRKFFKIKVTFILS